MKFEEQLKKNISNILSWEEEELVSNVYKNLKKGEVSIFTSNSDTKDNFALIINQSIQVLETQESFDSPILINDNSKENDTPQEITRVYILSKNLLDKGVSKTFLKKIFAKLSKNFVVYTLYIPEGASESDGGLPLSITNRLGIEQYLGKINNEQTGDSISIYGHFFSTSIYDIYKLYKAIGDSLFKDNLRIGIKESLGVNAAIKNTLQKEPDKFWLYNNGITMTVENRSFYTPFFDKLVFLKENISDITIVNGAQTVSNIASTVAELEADSKTNEQILKAIEDNGKVLLKIIQLVKDDSTQTNDQSNDFANKLKSEISVSLNRQKPITQEDIIYMNSAIIYINSIFEEENEGFHIIRRGEFENIDIKHYSLISLSRVILATLEKKLEQQDLWGKITYFQQISLINSKI